MSSSPQRLASPPDQITKIQKTNEEASLSGWNEELGAETSYRPTVDRASETVACFYRKQREATAAGEMEPCTWH